MAGHSKWNNIKNKKGKEDAKRAKVFTKMARNISVAVREGGPDPEFNPALKMAIERAKAENLPNDNIERAIKRGSGQDDMGTFEEVTYEGYGPDGVAVMVKALTDNRNRTAPDVRHAFEKNGGNMGTTGCVSFLFEHKGQIGIEKDPSIDEEELMLEAIEAGAEDFEVLEDGYDIITSPENFTQVMDALKASDYSFVISELTYLPVNTTELNSEESVKQMEKLIDMLEDNDDVQDVYTNWEQSDEE